MIFVPAASPALPAALSGQLRACKQGVQLVPLHHLLLQQSARELLEEAPLFREEGADRHVRLDQDAAGERRDPVPVLPSQDGRQHLDRALVEGPVVDDDLGVPSVSARTRSAVGLGQTITCTCRTRRPSAAPSAEQLPRSVMFGKPALVIECSKISAVSG